MQDDSESDDAGVANPVERDRHEDDNYSSGEGGSEIITVDSDNEDNVGNQLLDLSSDEEGLQRPAFNSTPKRSSKSGNQATHTLPGTSLSVDTEVFVNTLYDSVMCSRERAQSSNYLNACEVGMVQELTDHLLFAETDPQSGPAHDTKLLQSLLAGHQVPQRLPFLCLEAAQMRLQSHEDMRPVLVIRYRPSQHAIAVLRLIMQSEECTNVLKHLNIHVALVGSNFDDDGSDRNLITSLVSSAEVACQAANALASHRALIQEERELKRKQDEDFRLSPENKESEDDESEHSTIVDNIELRQKRIAAFSEQLYLVVSESSPSFSKRNNWPKVLKQVVVKEMVFTLQLQLAEKNSLY